MNRSIAELMGWIFEAHAESRPNRCAGLNPEPHWHNEHGVLRGVPDYYHDLNALRDGPEATLRDAWWQSTVSCDREGVYVAEWYNPADEWEYGIQADTEAAARALAAEAALKAMQHD